MRTLTDYYVRPLSEPDIEAIADEWRNRAQAVLGYDYFNLFDFISVVLKRQLRKRDPLRIRFLDRDSAGPPAKVTFRPLTLWVRVDIWSSARDRDDPFSRYVLAHEIGHLVLHDHEAKGFSSKTGERIPQGDRERSAEWQADKFADCFLAPINIVERLEHADDVVARCGVPLDVAARRLSEVSDHWALHSRHYGLDPCERCLSYDSQRMSNRVRCRTCGKVIGISL